MALATLICTAIAAMASPVRASIGSLEVLPPTPQCLEPFQVSVAGAFPDGCWVVDDIQFFVDGNDLRFLIVATDHWTPDTGCPAVIVPYSATRTLVNQPAGVYQISAFEQVESQRLTGDSRSIAFQITCRPQGIVTRAGISTCQQGTHEITDPCTGRSVLLESSSLNLEALVCQHVIVQGTEVGVECPVIDVQEAAPVDPACKLEVLGLLLPHADGDLINWQPFPCAESYDLIRGRLPGPMPGETSVDLGAVDCLADDLPASANPSLPLDPDVPPPDRFFFYQVRARTAFGLLPYGFSTSGLERIPSSGDCPP